MSFRVLVNCQSTAPYSGGVPEIRAVLAATPLKLTHIASTGAPTPSELESI